MILLLLLLYCLLFAPMRKKILQTLLQDTFDDVLLTGPPAIQATHRLYSPPINHSHVP